MMARKQQQRLITKAETVRHFGLTRNQVNYLFQVFHLQPLTLVEGDRRCKWYRYSDVARVVPLATLKRAS